MATEVVLGFRPHTYWTAVVAVSGNAGAPRVVARSRFDFAAGETRHVYHRAAAMGPAEGAAWIETVRAQVETMAEQALGKALAEWAGAGCTVSRAVVPRGGARIPDDLAQIVRSHSGQHAAEGEFYRDVVATACRRHGLEVTRVVEREIASLVSDASDRTPAALTAWLADLGRALGPPWSEDQRLAMLAGWLGLAQLEGASAG